MKPTQFKRAPNHLFTKLFPEHRTDLREESFESGQVLLEIDDPVRHLLFPTSGMISVVAPLSTGEIIEVGCVGRDGAVGVEPLLGRTHNFRRCMGQIPGTFVRMEASLFLKRFESNTQMREDVLVYSTRLVRELSQTAACNRVHSIEQRLARWLLICRDRTGSLNFELTHLFLGQMLGVRRPSVTLKTSAFQSAGLIRYKRGRIEILDRRGLEDRACECFDYVRKAG